MERKCNLANFFERMFAHVNVLSLRRADGVNQIKFERSPKTGDGPRMWLSAREVARSLHGKPEKNDSLKTVSGSLDHEDVFLASHTSKEATFEGLKGNPEDLLQKFKNSNFGSISEYSKVASSVSVVRRHLDRWICCCETFVREFVCYGVLGVQLYKSEVNTFENNLRVFI